MKIFKLIIVFMFVVVSCKKDDDSALIDTSISLVGVWEMTDYRLENGKITYAFEGQEIVSTYNSIGKDFDYQIIFSENPNLVTSQGSYTSTITSTILGVSETQEAVVDTDDLDGEIIAGLWRIDKNTIITDLEGVETAMQIAELTEKRLRLTIDVSDSEFLIPGDTSGLELFDVSASGVIHVTLER